jgi:YVTN family beta-propeller protein
MLAAHAGAQSLPSAWSADDVGTPSADGAATYSGGTFTVTGAGVGIGGTADGFMFVRRQMTGNGSIVARVQDNSAWMAGVMIRASLATTSVQGTMLFREGSGVAFERRRTTGGGSVRTTSSGGRTGWVKLERSGSTVTGSYSVDGQTWKVVGKDSISLPDTVYVGLAVTNGNEQKDKADFDNVSVQAGGATVPPPSPAQQPPTVSLTAPARGTSFVTPASITVMANAADSDGSVAKVDFFAGSTNIGTDTSSPYSIVWNNAAAGTHSLTAVARDNNGASTTSSARTITVKAPGTTASDTTAPTATLTSPANNAQVSGSVVVAATASDAVGVKSVTFLADGVAIGTDSSSPYSLTWSLNSVAIGSHTLRADARDAAGNVGVSTSVTVTVTIAPAVNQRPTVSLAVPTSGTSFVAPADITLTATAADSDGSVTKVDFYTGQTNIGTDSTSPYSVTWNNVAAGTYSLTAVAHDNTGVTTTSSIRTVTVTGEANQSPTVSLTAPANGASYQAPATISIAASATDTNGTVSRVDFYAGTTLIGSDASAPFSIDWTASAAGTYALSARAVDNAQATTTSSSVSVTVTAVAAGPTAVFEPSPDNGMVNSYLFEVFPQGSTTPVASKSLGKPPVVNGEMAAEISDLIASLPAGTYVATVASIGGGAITRSVPSAPFITTGGGATAVILSATSLSTASRATLTPTDGEMPPATPSAAAESDGTLWVTNASTGMVGAFNPRTGDVLAVIPVGLAPAGIATPEGAGKVYVADEGSDTISVIDRRTMRLADSIQLPSPFGRKPHELSASADGRFVYVAESGTNVVDVVDTATDRVFTRFSSGWTGSSTRAIASTRSGDVLYAVNDGATPELNTLVAVEAHTGRWIWNMPLDKHPSDLIVTRSGRIGAVSLDEDHAIRLVDLERQVVLADVDLGVGNLPKGLRLSADGTLLIVTLAASSSRVALVDLTRMGPAQVVSLDQPAGSVTVSPAELSYIVPGGSDGTAEVVAIHPASRTVVTRFRFPGGGSPGDVAFDPR